MLCFFVSMVYILLQRNQMSHEIRFSLFSLFLPPLKHLLHFSLRNMVISHIAIFTSHCHIPSHKYTSAALIANVYFWLCRGGKRFPSSLLFSLTGIIGNCHNKNEQEKDKLNFACRGDPYQMWGSKRCQSHSLYIFQTREQQMCEKKIKELTRQRGLGLGDWRSNKFCLCNLLGLNFPTLVIRKKIEIVTNWILMWILFCFFISNIYFH